MHVELRWLARLPLSLTLALSLDLVQEAKETLDKAKEQAEKNSAEKKAEFDMSSLKCEHCHAVLEEMLAAMLTQVEDYQKKAHTASQKGDEDGEAQGLCPHPRTLTHSLTHSPHSHHTQGKKLGLQITGYARMSTSTNRMKKSYSPQFRDIANRWSDAYDWEISDTTFWFSKVFGESFAEGGISTVNPRHHIVYERKNSLCHEEFKASKAAAIHGLLLLLLLLIHSLTLHFPKVCPDLKTRDFGANGSHDLCSSCIS